LNCKIQIAKNKEIRGEVVRQMNYRSIEYNDEECKLNPKILIDLLELIQKNEITENVGKKLVERIIDSGESPNEIVKKEDLSKVSDEENLISVVSEVIEANPKAVEDYKAGKNDSLNFLMGQVMKKTKGRADANKVIEILKENIK
jgi:aspartyl-tRNA(Asn)/glutamyl-tRNA(Gln) amidotransferase subunit B